MRLISQRQTWRPRYGSGGNKGSLLGLQGGGCAVRGEGREEEIEFERQKESEEEAEAENITSR